MILDEPHRPITDAEHAEILRYWRARAAANRQSPLFLTTTTRGPSRLRLAWWRLCAWFREAVR